MAEHSVKGGGQPISCWLLFHFYAEEMNNHPLSLGVTCGQYVEFPVVVGFLNQGYSFKSIASKFLTILNI